MTVSTDNVRDSSKQGLRASKEIQLSGQRNRTIVMDARSCEKKPRNTENFDFKLKSGGCFTDTTHSPLTRDKNISPSVNTHFLDN